MKYFRDDTSSIDETPARELAADIIEKLDELKWNDMDSYFEVEDLLTELINSWFEKKEKEGDE